jgi:hypothetical protein
VGVLERLEESTRSCIGGYSGICTKYIAWDAEPKNKSPTTPFHPHIVTWLLAVVLLMLPGSPPVTILIWQCCCDGMLMLFIAHVGPW